MVGVTTVVYVGGVVGVVVVCVGFVMDFGVYDVVVVGGVVVVVVCGVVVVVVGVY